MSGWNTFVLIALLILAGLGIYLLVASLTSPSGAASRSTVSTDSTVQVSGTASVEAQPDQATLTATVQTVAPTAAQATADNDSLVRQVLARVESLQSDAPSDAPPPTIETQRYDVTPQYAVLPNGQRDTSAAPISFRAEHALEFKFVDDRSALLGARIGALTTLLVGSGVTQLSGPFFSVTERNKAREQARQAAVRVAQQRAAELARLSGVAVVGLKQLTDEMGGGGVFFAERASLADSTDSDAPIRAPQSETIRHTVQATYFVA